jgi:hypothetical protein
MPETLTIEEENGIKAIQYLQGVVSIDESRDKALRGWRGMSEHEKVTTMHAYRIMSNRKY